MVKTTFDALISQYGFGNLKSISLSSGRIFLIHGKPDVPGRYHLEVDNDLECLVMTHVTKPGPEVDNTIDIAEISTIESMSFFPS